MKKININYIIYFIIGLIVIVSSILIYNFFKENNQIILNGDTNISIYENNNYIEPGFQGLDKNGNDITNQVEVVSNLNVNLIGDYSIEYHLGKTVVKRNIKVLHNDLDDITMSYNGNELVLWKDSIYNIPSINAYDAIDGDISSKVIYNDNINISCVGEYTINYFVTNSRNVMKNMSLKVIVKDLEYLYSENYVGSDYTGNFSIGDSNFSYVIKPDISRDTNRNFKYIYNDNNIYKFKIYDINDNYLQIDKLVNNVDKTSPSVSCEVSLYDDYNVVNVSASDNNDISNYQYVYGNNKVDLTSNTYKFSELSDDVSVNVSDIAGNIGSAKCKVKDLSTSFDRTYSEFKASNGVRYMLYIPSGYTYRKDLPFVVYLHGKGEADPVRTTKVNNNGFPYYINKGHDYNFIMMAPQTNDESAHIEERMEALKEVLSKYHLNPNRIIISGFSYGAKYSYELIYRYPDFFAGCIPVAFYPTFCNYDDWIEKTSKTPILAFHGTKDQYYNEHKNALNRLSKVTSNVKFVTLEGKDHPGSWPPVFENNKEVLDFIENSYLN